MPLMKGKSKAAFSHNVAAEMHAGKPQKQSLAIAYAVKRRMAHKAKGGQVEHYPTDNSGNYMGHPEPSHSAHSGHPMGYAHGGKIKEYPHKGQMGQESVPMPSEGRDPAEYMAEGGKLPKLGTGARFSKLEHSLAHKPGIHNPAAVAASIGRKKFGAKKMSALAHHKHMAEGGMVPDEDEAREHDEVYHEEMNHNEDLDPGPAGGEPTSHIADEHLEGKALEHEDLPEPLEAHTGEHIEPDEEDLPAAMLAMGGIAHRIRMKKMAEGGPVDPVMNMDADQEPELPFNHDTYPDPDDTEHESILSNADQMRTRIRRIMENLHKRHLGR
jgi:hypothetical protein